MTYLDLVGIQLGTMIPIWFNLLILFFIFKKFLYKPVMNIIEERNSQVEDMYSKARTAKENALAQEQEYTAKLATAKDEAGEIIKSATVYAKKKEEEIIEQAQKDAVALTQKANKQIEQDKKKAYEDIKTDISTLSVEIAQSIIKKEINAESHKDLINDFIENVGEVR